MIASSQGQPNAKPTRCCIPVSWSFYFATSLSLLQVCEVRAFSLLIDYTPMSLDVQAIRKGQLVNLVNLISWKVSTIQY